MVVSEGVDEVYNFRLFPVDNEIRILLGRKSLCLWNLVTKKRKFEPIDLKNLSSCIR